jgi:hypothetical protein
MQVAFGIQVLKKQKMCVLNPATRGRGGLLHLQLGICLALPKNEKRLPVSRADVIFVNGTLLISSRDRGRCRLRS